MSTTYRARLEAMVQGLRRNRAVRVQRSILSPGAEAHELFSLRHRYGDAFPEDLATLYSQVGDIDLAWSAQLGERTLTGSVRLLPVHRVFSAWEDHVWFEEMDHDDPRRLLKPLDMFEPERCVALCPVPGPAELCYHELYGDIWPTRLSVTRWFELLCLSRGVTGWIEACCEGAPGADEARASWRALGELFDDVTPESIPHPAP